jgi:hypothetical protein
MDRITLIGKDEDMRENNAGNPQKLQIESIVHRTLDNDNAMRSSMMQ